MTPIRSAALAALGLALASPAAARPATCLVEVDGATVIDGPCDFDAFDPDGSFEVMGTDGPHFATVIVTAPGVAEGSWNADPAATHAHDPLGRLVRDGACWAGERARVCAW